MIPLQGASEGDDYADLVTPDGRLFWTSPDMVTEKGPFGTPGPYYTTAQAGLFFFGNGSRWMYKWLITHPKLSHPEIGELQLARTNTSVPARRWRLYDVEVFGHILAAEDVITGIQLTFTVRLIKLTAQMWGFRL